MNKNHVAAGLLALAILLGLALFFTNREETNNGNNNPSVSNFEECVEAGYPVLESYPPQCKTPDGKTFAQDIGNELDKLDLIRLESPRPNQVVSSPMLIKGEARGNWYFEASFPAKLLDANGNQLAIMPIQAKGEWMTTDFVPFEATMTFPTPTTSTGTLILEKDNASGLPEYDDKLIVPVRFSQTTGGNTSQETMMVKAYFGNSSAGAECEKVVSVSREIPKTVTTGRAALEELLKGPTTAEKNSGYTTAINPGVKINSLTIQDGVARADFSKELNTNVAGSCRVNAIRAQITETLKQFSSVNNVIISINGNSEGILEP